MPINKTTHFCYQELTATFDRVTEMNGILEVGVTMAAEMVQKYHRSEIPFIDENAPPDVQYVKVFKPYEELKKAIDDLKDRGITQLPFVMPHTNGTFLKDQVPEKAKQYLTRFVTDTDVKAWVKKFRADDTTRKIKATLYIPLSKNDPKFIDAVKKGKVIDVSIGFICSFDDGGEFNGEEYLLTQRDIQIGHLAGLIHDRGKCPSGICGINQDSTVEVGDHDHEFHQVPHFIEAIDFDHREELATNFVEPTSPNELPKTATIGPLGGLNTSQNISHTVEAKKMPDIEIDFKKAIADKDQELANLKAQLATIKESQDKAHESKLEAASLKETIKQRDLSLEAMKKTVADAEAKVKKFEDNERVSIIDWMKNKKVEEIDGKKIEEYCLHDLELLKKFKMKELDDALKNGSSPMPSQTDRDTKTSGQDKKPTFVSMTADSGASEPSQEANK